MASSTARDALRHWLFAAAVGTALVAAAAVGVLARPPSDVPGFALEATAVYRVEVATAVFSALYFGLLAFVLALEGRAFTEFGSAGVKAHDLSSSDRVAAIRDQERSLESALQMVKPRVTRPGPGDKSKHKE